MKKAERLVISPISGTIYWAEVKETKDCLAECVGEKRDVTMNALKVVYQWFLDKANDEASGVFRIRFGKENPWLELDLSNCAKMDGGASDDNP
jgi:hypothetical protein